MTGSVIAKLAALKTAPMPALKQQWRDLFDKEPPPYNRAFLESRLAYRIQELAYGGLKIYQHDKRQCDDCDATSWTGQGEPTLVDTREQVLDPMTAYQITSMMEGVVKRGTATVVTQVGKPIAGKTGTTNDEKDAWFVGFSPDLVVGVFIGYDKPRPMGKGQTGGVLAAPIFAEFMKVALKDAAPKEFQVPPGLELIPIDWRTGLRAQGGEEVILEAFKPGTAPPETSNFFFEDQVSSFKSPRIFGERGFSRSGHSTAIINWFAPGNASQDYDRGGSERLAQVEDAWARFRIPPSSEARQSAGQQSSEQEYRQLPNGVIVKVR